LLVKVKLGESERKFTWISKSAYNKTETIAEFTMPFTWKIHMEWDCYATTSWKDVKIAMTVDWTNVWNFTKNIPNSSWSYTYSYTRDAFAPAWSSVGLYIRSNWSFTAWIQNTNVDLVKYSSSINPINWKVSKLLNIWDLWVINIYWKSDDWKYYWWIITWTTDTVETGEITLWNAVGYLEVNYNWNIVKIPYYN